MTTSLIGGFGVVGLGVSGQPARHRPSPELCAEFDHPGATYNPWQDKTWCLCGDVIRQGNHATHDACCCGGRLVACQHP
ncbi:hypothetical protein [Nocardioides aurantiacus]|uniref:Uncharacterized protein n=1 Tax=Nocardioides aurantiacus TaxID=86796 RepID=A0A3N2CW56_9ACTN|nr:hypothetical protein [Nocardioides aurantiacus]ROR91719.1 hypothetical protein EDD33_2594 [Nocardioides aurantiacus]